MPTQKKQKLIYQEQDRILLALKKIRPFPYVLSGGTALSRFYFHHRFSEDLDFFCEEINFSFEKIEKVATLLRKQGITCELAIRSDLPGHLKAVAYSMGDGIQIKVDFLEDPFTGMWNPIKNKTDTGVVCRIDTLDQIYYRKIFSLMEQWHKSRKIRRIKDLVDLYALHRYHRTIEKTVVFYRKNHVPIDEEKLIVILGSLRKEEIIRGFENISNLKGFDLTQVYDGLKRAGDNLLKKGLR